MLFRIKSPLLTAKRRNKRHNKITAKQKAHLAVCFLFVHLHLQYIQGDLMTHHNFRDNIKHLLVAAAAAGGAMSYLLYVFESLEHVFEIFMFVKRVRYVCVANLLAIANHIILYHNITSVL